MEQQTPDELKSPFPNFLRKSLPSPCSGSLFSTIVTLYALILLYFPSLFFDIIFSPLFIFTGILLLSLLRLAAIQTTGYDSHSHSHSTQTPQKSKNPIPSSFPQEAHKLPNAISDAGSDSDHKPYYSDSFREWNVRAPLEVIYEEYGEGEDGDDDDEDDDRNNAAVFNQKIERRVLGIDEKYPISLSMYYPESDSDSSSEDGNWESSEGAFFKWNEEDREELIEIALDGKRNCGDDCRVVEEDNLIEIDIFPAKDGRVSR